MTDSDSDAALVEEIPINSNHLRIPNPESQWNSNNNHVRHHSRSRHGHHRRVGAPKHHHDRGKSSFSFDDTSDYFELARQARLLGKGDERSTNTPNDPGNPACVQRGNEARDRGKGVDHTGGSRINGSRFQWNKSFPNQKNKHTFDNPRRGGSATFNGFSAQRRLVRNGCISPDNVACNAGPSEHCAEQIAGMGDKGKGKLGVGTSRRIHKPEGGVVLHEPQETR